MIGPAGQVNGPFTVTQAARRPRTFRISFPTRRRSAGRTRVTLASNIADINGNQLDTNLNAGIDLLRGTTGGATTTVVYSAPATYKPSPLDPGAERPAPADRRQDVGLDPDRPRQLPGVRRSASSSTSREPNDPDLQITLVAPNGAVGRCSSPGGPARRARTPTSRGRSSPTPGEPELPVVELADHQRRPAVLRAVLARPSRSRRSTASQAQGHLEAGHRRPLGQGERPGRDAQQLVADVPEGGPDQRPRRAGRRPGDRQLPDLHDRPDQPAVEQHLDGGRPGPVVNAGSPRRDRPTGSPARSARSPSTRPTRRATRSSSGASGGVWKTTNFLTTDPQGPTWIPLTDFGPTSGINIGSIAVFPRNNDPRQSIVFAGTGDAGRPTPGTPAGNTSNGVGFIISMDGGATWTLLDSTNNNLPFGQPATTSSPSPATAGGTATAKVVVDPHPTPTGQVIIYAALRGANGGLWRSIDTGQTWTEALGRSQGDATDVALDYTSATVNAVSNPTGNVNMIYAAFPGSGVYISPNRGRDPQPDGRRERRPPVPRRLNGTTGGPGQQRRQRPDRRAGGRIVLAKPAPLPASDPERRRREHPLRGLALRGRRHRRGSFDGVYLTKDNGQTWTKLQINGLPDANFLPEPGRPDQRQHQDRSTTSPATPLFAARRLRRRPWPSTRPTRTSSTSAGRPTATPRASSGSTPPTVYDSHALVPTSNNQNDGGAVAVQLDRRGLGRQQELRLPVLRRAPRSSFAFNQSPYLNLTLDPNNPFAANSTILTFNVAVVHQRRVRGQVDPVRRDALRRTRPRSCRRRNIHSIVTFVDPLTGHTRLIVGDDQGVFTGELTADGTLDHGGRHRRLPDLLAERQPPDRPVLLRGRAAEHHADATGTPGRHRPAGLFYGNGYNLGQVAVRPERPDQRQHRRPGVDRRRRRRASSPSTSADQAGIGVGVDQQGNNVVYRYLDPAYGGNRTDFFQVSIDGGQTGQPDHRPGPDRPTTRNGPAEPDVRRRARRHDREPEPGPARSPSATSRSTRSTATR